MRKDEYQREREQCVTPYTITIKTRVPSKWRFVDQETGEVWRWDPVDASFGIDHGPHCTGGVPHLLHLQGRRRVDVGRAAG